MTNKDEKISPIINLGGILKQTDMNRLSNLGLIRVGQWTYYQNRLRSNLTSNTSTENVLYIFSSNGDIKYIGKTRNNLFTRMHQYQQPHNSQSTNTRVNTAIVSHLQNGNQLDIHILIDNGQISFHGFKVNLADGIEDTLINLINPAWNLL